MKRAALYAIAALCGIYVAATFILWVACLWAFVLNGPFMGYDEGWAMVFGGALAAGVVGTVGYLALAAAESCPKNGGAS